MLTIDTGTIVSAKGCPGGGRTCVARPRVFHVVGVFIGVLLLVASCCSTSVFDINPITYDVPEVA